MNLWMQISILVVFGIVLAGAAGVVVKQASSLAQKFGFTSFTMGFLLLGVFTSTPEIFVAIQATADGIPQLSVGNLLGGSVLLLSFVMGVTAILLGGVVLDHHLSIRELWAMMGVIAAPIAVLWDGRLTRTEGLFLVVIYGLHAFLLNRDGKKKKRERGGLEGLGGHLVILAAGVVVMFISSRFIVAMAEAIMGTLSIAPLIFGLFFLSFGTNLPEFALAFESIRHRRREIAFGDFLGSSAANTLILGILGIIAPFTGGTAGLFGALVLLGSVCIYFLWAISSGREITRKEGVGLLVFYLLFVAYELFM